jgi:uncharacterized protein
MMPSGIGIVDLMIGFPSEHPRQKYGSLRTLTKDAESQEMAFPAEYMFKDVPDALGRGQDPIGETLAAMDRHGIAIGLVGLRGQLTQKALALHPERFAASLEIDPNDIAGEVRRIREAHDEFGLAAVTSFPAGCSPQVAVSDPRYYPIFQTCVDLDIAVIMNAGIAGPRVPSEGQHVMHFDDVCYDFPDLRLVMRHGAEPWADLAVKLMLKWPRLYYITSGFAPKYYPNEIVEYANTRGAGKIMYAGYYPMGLSLDRIFAELPAVPFRDHVWPKFLRENALEVFNLAGRR